MSPVRIFYSYNCACGSETDWAWPDMPEAIETVASLVFADLVTVIEFRTSQIYPIEVIDGLDSSALLLNAYTFSGLIESTDSRAQLMAGALDVVAGYATYGTVIDATETTAQLLFGSLGAVAGTVVYDDSVDAYETTAELTAGTLLVVAGYVDYEMADEAIETTAELIGATLL